MATADINVLAVIVSAVVYFIVGGLWYSPLLFARPWMRALGVTEEEIKQQGSPVGAYLVSLIGAFVTAFVLAIFLDYAEATSLQSGLTVGFFAWLGFVATTTAPPYFYEDRPKPVYVIYAGYTLAGFLVMSVILSLWR